MSVVISLAAADGLPLAGRHWPPPREPWASLLIVHGLAEYSGRYERAGAVLARAGIDTHALDLRGFGRSGGRRAWVGRWGVYLDDIDRALEAIRRSGMPTVLLGHSFGAIIALDHALSSRGPADLLVLSALPLVARLPLPQRVAVAALGRLLPTLEVPNGLRGEQLSRDPAVGEAYFADPLVHTRSTLKLGRESFATMARLRAAWRRLAVPTLVIQGGQDTIVPPEASAPMAELPAVERVVYPALRHELFNEPEGEQVLGEVAGWIRRQAALLRFPKRAEATTAPATAPTATSARSAGESRSADPPPVGDGEGPEPSR